MRLAKPSTLLLGLVMAASFTSITGCAARVSTPGVDVEARTPGVYTEPAGGSFCPPGQAKKGRC
ncbi:hypothetical protein ACKC9G_02140 [Pokkaliibacter sp. CJK22405]|uniref:hypothetical protein n=1 Tax=Pokkaliibacter sp. CJK22405 TaxID=3384615 RepID=UPI003985357B